MSFSTLSLRSHREGRRAAPIKVFRSGRSAKTSPSVVVCALGSGPSVVLVDGPPEVAHLAVDLHVDRVEVPPPVGERAHPLDALPADLGLPWLFGKQHSSRVIGSSVSLGRESGRAAPISLPTRPAVMKRLIGRPLASVTANSLVLMPPFVPPVSHPGPSYWPTGSKPYSAPPGACLLKVSGDNVCDRVSDH